MGLVLLGDHLKTYSRLHVLRLKIWLPSRLEIFQKLFKVPYLHTSCCYKVIVAQTQIICCQCQCSHQPSPLPPDSHWWETTLSAICLLLLTARLVGGSNILLETGSDAALSPQTFVYFEWAEEMTGARTVLTVSKGIICGLGRPKCWRQPRNLVSTGGEIEALPAFLYPTKIWGTSSANVYIWRATTWGKK